MENNNPTIVIHGNTGMNKKKVLLVVGIVALVGLIGGSSIFVSFAEVIESFVTFIEGMGVLSGSILFVVIYVSFVLLFLPAVLLTLTAGFLFGLARGALTVWLGMFIGSPFSFFVRGP